MSGFTGNDGSQLIGGLNPSGIVQAGIVDAWGRFITEDQIRAYTLSGNAYSVTTGKLSAPSGGNTLGWQLFNPANSGKTLLIYSLILIYNSAALHDIRMTTADVSGVITNWTNVAVTPVNNKGGGAASVATSGYSNSGLSGGLSGSSRETTGTQNSGPVEILTNGECIVLPATNSINGVAIYVTSGGANSWAVTAEYLEFS